jgi:hypothetical protein
LDAMGVPMRMTLQGSSIMMRYFLILRFQQSGLPVMKKNIVEKLIDLLWMRNIKTLIVFSDQFSDAEYRHLRRCVKEGFL